MLIMNTCVRVNVCGGGGRRRITLFSLCLLCVAFERDHNPDASNVKCNAQKYCA